MSKHTAAPWIIDAENNLIHSADDRHTIVCSIGNIKHPAVMADARLIAAAPEMLLVLELIAQLPDATGAIAANVVAKATGVV
jgi:hypothetical protein